jgi:hypothetical protein
LAAAPGEATEIPGASAAGNQCADDARGGARRKSAGGEANGAAGGLVVASAANDGEVDPSSDDTEFSVEGLGLADLLAGALAAYRAI